MNASPPPRRLRVRLGGHLGEHLAEGDMAVLEFGSPDRPVDLVFAHANGFNALTYRALLGPLGEAFRVWAPDLRGHGRTTLPADPRGRSGWGDHARDMAGLLAAARAERPEAPAPVAAGHSMGAVAMLLAAARGDGARDAGARDVGAARGLVLFDPVIWSRATTTLLNLPGATRIAARNPRVEAARRRRARFDDRAQALAAYRGRGAFRGWDEAVLADYLEDGLVADSPEGDGLRLACDPAWEASNYAAQAHDPWRALRRSAAPVVVLKGETRSLCGLPDQDAAGLMIRTVPGTDHFLPILMPDVARAALVEAIRRGAAPDRTEAA